jgi:hypothetical protein
VRRCLAETLVIPRKERFIWASSRASSAPSHDEGSSGHAATFARGQWSSRSGAADLRAVRRQTRKAPRSPIEPISRPENSGAICRDRDIFPRKPGLLIASDWCLKNSAAHRAARRVRRGITAGGRVRECHPRPYPDPSPKGAYICKELLGLERHGVRPCTVCVSGSANASSRSPPPSPSTTNRPSRSLVPFTT